MRTVRSIMRRDPPTVDPEATIREALARLDEGPEPQLPVVEAGELVGILSDRDLRVFRRCLADVEVDAGGDRARMVLASPVRSWMRTAVTCVDADAPVTDAVEGLLERELGALPVLDGHALVGLLTVGDLLRNLRALVGDRERRVADAMTTDVFGVQADDGLGDALEAMLAHGVREVPVLGLDRTLLGVVSHRDVLGGTGPVERAMRPAGAVVSPGTRLEDAARLLLAVDAGMLPVVEAGRVVGLLTESAYVRLSVEAD